MSERTDQDKENRRKLREFRQALVPPVDWNNEPNPMADLKALIEDVGETVGFKPDRQMYFFCGLHGQQRFSKAVFAGIQLECGCRVVSVDKELRFTTSEERGDDD